MYGRKTLIENYRTACDESDQKVNRLLKKINTNKYVIDYCGQNRNDRIKTGIKEIRAEKAKEVSSCEFSLQKILKLAKLSLDSGIGLKLDENLIYEDGKRIKRYYSISGGKKGRKEIAEIYAFNIMIHTMIEGEVFCPVEVKRKHFIIHHSV